MAAPNVNTPSKAYNDMQRHFALPSVLMGGTLAMRDAQHGYLPQFAKESNDRYTVRINNATLYNAYKHTIETLSQRPFGEPATLAEDSEPFYVEIAADVDLSKTALTAFARQCMTDLLVYGKCHILADYPNTAELSTALGRALTVADETEHKIRPYLTRLSPANVIAWTSSRNWGVEELTSVRYREESIEPDPADPYGEIDVNRVKVWTKYTVETYRKETKQDGRGEDKWVLVGEPALNTLGHIPLVTVYANRKGLLKAMPPLEDLAHLNQEHWRSKSDQDTIETVNRIPMLSLMGFDDDEVASLEIGVFRSIHNSKTDASVSIVETTGEAARIGRESLTAVEKRMHELSMAPLIRKPGNPTATELSIEAGREVSDLEAYVMSLEVGLADALHLCAEWKSLPLDPPTVQIDSDFGALPSQKDLEETREDYKLGAITKRRYLTERKRLGLYGEDFDIEAELEAQEFEEGNMGDESEGA